MIKPDDIITHLVLSNKNLSFEYNKSSFAILAVVTLTY